ncbi:MAG: hypothetical protein ACLQMF_02145 [Rectinemataceae bacterium]
MKIVETRSTILAIYYADSIDFRALSNSSFASNFSTDYHFGQNANPGPLAIEFTNGFFKIDDRKIVIDRVVIDPRRIIVAVGGTTKDAEEILRRVELTVSSADTRAKPKGLSPISEFYETLCIAKFNNPFAKLFSTGDIAKVIPILEAATSIAPAGMKVEIEPISIRYRISYQGESTIFTKRQIQVNDKVLQLDIRDGTDSTEKSVFASMPVDSDSIIKILEEIDSSIS